MKKIILFLILFVCVNFAQDEFYEDRNNSSTTNLGGGAKFTGTATNCLKYNSIKVFINANDSSATNGIKIQFSANGTSGWVTGQYWTYIKSDSLTPHVAQVKNHYYRIVYTNGTDSITSFALKCILVKSPVYPVDEMGRLATSSNVTISGVATDASVDQLEALTDSVQVNLEEANGLLQQLDNNTDLVETKLDSIEVNVEEGNGLLQQLDNNTDLIETKLDSVEVNIEENNTLSQSIKTVSDSIEVNVEESNGLLQQLDNNTDLVETKLDSIEVNIEESNTLLESITTSSDSVEVNIEEGNGLLQQLDNNTDLIETKLDSIEVNVEELNGLAQQLDNNTDLVETKLDSIEVNVEENNTISQSIKTLSDSIEVNIEEANGLLQQLDNNTDLIETKLDSIEVNVEEGNGLLQQVDNNTDLIETKLDSIEVNVEEGNTLLQSNKTSSDSIEVNIEEGNGLLQQLDNNGDLVETKLDSVEVNIEEGNTLAQYNRALLALANDSSAIGRNVARIIQGKIDSVNAEAERTHLELIKKFSQVTGDSLFENMKENNTLAQYIRTLLILANDSSAIARNDIRILKGYLQPTLLISTGAASITTAANLTTTTAMRYVEVTNNTSGEVLYYGSTNGVTSSDGCPIFYGEKVYLYSDNITDFYFVNDGSGTIDVRYAIYYK